MVPYAKLSKYNHNWTKSAIEPTYIKFFLAKKSFELSLKKCQNNLMIKICKNLDCSSKDYWKIL